MHLQLPLLFLLTTAAFAALPHNGCHRNKLCNGVCVNPWTDPNHCGNCRVPKLPFPISPHLILAPLPSPSQSRPQPQPHHLTHPDRPNAQQAIPVTRASAPHRRRRRPNATRPAHAVIPFPAEPRATATASLGQEAGLAAIARPMKVVRTAVLMRIAPLRLGGYVRR